MKWPFVLATILLASTGAIGQSDQSQQQTTPPAQQQTTQESGGMAHHPHGQMHHNHARMRERTGQMQAHMQEMQSRLEKMRADADKVQDPATRTALLDQADMWEQTMKHMQSHMHMMGEGGMHHMDMMSGEHQGCHCKRRHPSDEERKNDTNPR